MTSEDIRTLEMIASNCVLPKVQRDMLQDIIEREIRHKWHDLRKDQTDLPTEYGYYLCYETYFDYGLEQMVKKFTVYSFVPEFKEFFAIGTDASVLAWKYIEQIEEVEG